MPSPAGVAWSPRLAGPIHLDAIQKVYLAGE